MIQNFEDFCRELNSCGFSMGGGNAKGIFALIDYDWLNQDMLDTPVKWHCGDPEVDPWEWRMRVLEERTDIAYSKVFFKTSGFITKDWYPYFYAVRRNGETFEEAYERGGISHTAKRIYDIVRDGYVAPHEIKALGGFGKEDKSSFDRALVELQMGMFITMTGRKQKKNKYGIEYGWNSTVFTTVENFWAERDFEIPELDADKSYEKMNQEKYLKVFLEDGNIPIDNSATERAIHPFTIGRANWHIIDTIHGAEASATIYSLVETAKANKLKIYEYLKHLLTEIPKHIDDTSLDFLEDLLPWSEKLPEECHKKI